MRTRSLACRRFALAAAAAAAAALLRPSDAGAWGAYYHRGTATKDETAVAPTVSTASVVVSAHPSAATAVSGEHPRAAAGAPGAPAAAGAAVSHSSSTTTSVDGMSYVRSGGLQLANPTAPPNTTTAVGGGVSTHGGYPVGYQPGAAANGGPPTSPLPGGSFGSGPPSACAGGTTQDSGGGCVACPAGMHPDGNGGCALGDGGSAQPPVAAHQRVY